jgi:hypothetical protein
MSYSSFEPQAMRTSWGNVSDASDTWYQIFYSKIGFLGLDSA